MRVNVDSKVLTDARFKIAAQQLGISWMEVLGRIIPVWLHAYESRSPHARRIEVDAQAEQAGFCDALVTAGLAQVVRVEGGHTVVRLAGAEDHIEWLEIQDAKRAKALAAKRVKAGLPAERPAGHPGARPYISGSGSDSSSGSTHTRDPNRDGEMRAADAAALSPTPNEVERAKAILSVFGRYNEVKYRGSKADIEKVVTLLRPPHSYTDLQLALTVAYVAEEMNWNDQTADQMKKFKPGFLFRPEIFEEYVDPAMSPEHWGPPRYLKFNPEPQNWPWKRGGGQ